MPEIQPLDNGDKYKKRPKIITEVEEITIYTPVIKVAGIGGAGGNAINRMIEMGLKGVEFIAINTDAQDLHKSRAQIRLQIGHHLTKGLGAGGDPQAGERAAMEDVERIREILDGAHMLFLTTGLGGGTGSGATPIIAQIMRQANPETLMVAVMTLPFSFEGPIRTHNALRALEQIKKYVDAYIVIPNDNLVQIAQSNLPMRKAFLLADDVLFKAVQSLTDMIVHPGYINVDFADVYNVLKNKGRAVFGVGSSDAEGRALKAVQEAINCPLLENSSIESASDVLLNIMGKDLTVQEIKEACDYIYSLVDQSTAQVIFGYAEREDLPGFNITVIAAGFSDEPSFEVEAGDLRASDDISQSARDEEPLVRQAVPYGTQTPTPHTLERAFDQPDLPRRGSRLDTEALKSPAIKRRHKYRYPRFVRYEGDED